LTACRIGPRQVLLDLAGTVDRGQWFAAAKEAGFLDLALEFAAKSASAGTLARAARDFIQSNPEWAAQVAVIVLRELITASSLEPQRQETIMASGALLDGARAMGKIEWVRSAIEKLLDLRPSEMGRSNQAVLRGCAESRTAEESRR
jgi:hypothetical protein